MQSAGSEKQYTWREFTHAVSGFIRESHAALALGKTFMIEAEMQPIAYAAVRTPTGRNSTCSRYCEPWSAWIGLLLGTFVCPDGPLRGVLFLLSRQSRWNSNG